MALYPIASSYDGQRITVDDYLKDPLRIPALVLDLMQNEFIIESVLRNAGQNNSGAVVFEKSTPLFAQKDPSIRQEFAEVPAVTGAVGEKLVAYSYERALAITVSDAMRRRQIVDPVTRQITQVRNSMVKSWNLAFFALLDANIGSNQIYAIDPTAAWDSANSIVGSASPLPFIIRDQIADAAYLVNNAFSTDQTTPTTAKNYFGFEADTLIIDHTAKLALFKSQDFARPYIGDAATSSIQFSGVMPRQVMGLDVLVSHQCPTGSAYILQRGRAGFYSDELPMTATPLYRQEPRKVWRSDVQRASAMGVDQPYAVVKLTGVTLGTGAYAAPAEQSGGGTAWTD